MQFFLLFFFIFLILCSSNAKNTILLDKTPRNPFDWHDFCTLIFEEDKCLLNDNTN